MSVGQLYHRASGAIIGRVVGNDLSAYVSADVDVYPGEANADTQYVIDGSPPTLGTRTDVTFSAPAVVTVGDTVTLSGLPDPCWLEVSDSPPLQVTGGSVSRTPPAGEYLVGLIGAHRGEAVVVVKGRERAALDADPRWQALQAATPAQVDAWLNANVTDLASARGVLKLLLMAVRKLGA